MNAYMYGAKDNNIQTKYDGYPVMSRPPGTILVKRLACLLEESIDILYFVQVSKIPYKTHSGMFNFLTL